MEITEIKIFPVFGNKRIKALVEIIFDNKLEVTELRIINGKNRLFVEWPISQHSGARNSRALVRPINKEYGDFTEKRILDEYHNSF